MTLCLASKAESLSLNTINTWEHVSLCCWGWGCPVHGGISAASLASAYQVPTAHPSGLPRWLSGKESTCQCRRYRKCGFNPWVWKIPWRRKWQPTPVFLPGESHGQRSLAGYSPRGLKKPERLNNNKHTLPPNPVLCSPPDATPDVRHCRHPHIAPRLEPLI